MLHKISYGNILSYFLQKTGFDILMQIVSSGDNLHEMSNHVFQEKIRKIVSICHLLNLPRGGKD